MSSIHSLSSNYIADNLEQALEHLKKAKNIMIDTEAVNYKILADFHVIMEFLREEISIEKER